MRFGVIRRGFPAGCGLCEVSSVLQRTARVRVVSDAGVAEREPNPDRQAAGPRWSSRGRPERNRIRLLDIDVRLPIDGRLSAWGHWRLRSVVASATGESLTQLAAAVERSRSHSGRCRARVAPADSPRWRDNPLQARWERRGDAGAKATKGALTWGYRWPAGKLSISRTTSFLVYGRPYPAFCEPTTEFGAHRSLTIAASTSSENSAAIGERVSGLPSSVCTRAARVMLDTSQIPCAA